MTRNKFSYCVAQGTNEGSYDDLVFFSFHSVTLITIQQTGSLPYYEAFLILGIYIPSITKLIARLFVGVLMVAVKTDLCICMALLGRIFRYAGWLDPKDDVSKVVTIDLPSFDGIHEEYELNRFLFFFVDSLGKISLFLYSGS